MTQFLKKQSFETASNLDFCHFSDAFGVSIGLD